MNEFNFLYIRMLRKQVDDEIQFLISNGHDNSKIYVPCMFCVKHNTHYTCKRLYDLYNFRTNIDSQGNRKAIVATEKRRSIGFEPKVDSQPTVYESGVQFPLMFPKL